MKKIFIFILIVIVSASCESLLEPDPAITGQVETGLFYTDFNGAFQGINGVYASLREPYKSMWWIDVLSDDSQNSGGDIYEEHALTSGDGISLSIWSTWYSTLNRANVFLDRAPLIKGLQGNQAILQNQFIGEAYFIRALSYFNLVRIFGGVPLIVHEIKDVNTLNMPRNTVDEVYTQIISDLTEAIKYLPTKHPNPALIQPVVNITGGMEVGRATLGAAKTLLGNVYLIRNESAKAEQVLQEVVNSNVYSLLPTYTANFNALGGTKNNAESVFEIQYATAAQLSGAQHDLAYQFGPPEDVTNPLARNRPTDNTLDGSILLQNTLVQAFPAGDLRKAATVKYGTVAPIKSVVAKYYVVGGSNMGSTNWPVYRYSETILLLAEALQNQGKDAPALTELNKVHANARTGLTTLTGLTGNSLRDAIRFERRLELNLEIKRWFDLNRWGLLESVMTAHGRPVQANTNGLLPIPQTEIDKNPNLTQNPGY